MKPPLRPELDVEQIEGYGIGIVDWVLIWMIVLIIIISLYLVLFPTPRLADRCLANGYPEYRYTRTGEIYCIRRMGGTDEVKLLDEIVEERESER